MPIGPGDPFPPALFRRQDESPDHLFYTEPRLVVHIDEYAIAALEHFFRLELPAGGVVLDLMSSWRSHLPREGLFRKVVGLGLNATELAENPQLDERLLHDLNANPGLPFKDESFDAVMVTVSIQYVVRPVELFAEVCRVLQPGAGLYVVYSDRMFPTKATAVWQGLDDMGRGRLIASYFGQSGGWGGPALSDITPRLGFRTDPLYVVMARRPARPRAGPGPSPSG